jgi:hemolysin activation/secretion protein
VGFNLGDLWDDDNQLGYQYTRSTARDGLEAHSGSYTLPLPWRDTITVFGSWARAEATTEDLFDLTGTSWQAGIRYTRPLPSSPEFTESLVVGADYKWSNNDLGFGGTQVFASPASIVQGVVGYLGTLADAQGSTSGSITAFLSPGGIGGLNSDRDFEVQRPGSTASYEYVQASLGRTQRLPDDFTVVLTGLAQLSSARLLASEQFGLGGEGSVRGYDERIVEGDDGVSAQLELRTPARHLLGGLADQTQALVFIDAGRVFQKDPQPGEMDTSLASFGPGLRLRLGNYGTVKADYGWDLVRLAGTRSGRVHISAILSF